MSLLDDSRIFIEQNRLLDCDVVVVAVSGGPDSMCLLDVLLSLSENSVDRGGDKDEPRPTIVVAHLNHGLRGEASDRDEELVREYCKHRGVPFFSQKSDISGMANAEGLGLEEAGRKARYAFFDEVAQQYEQDHQCVRIAVAHRREDRAETMLINLFRGAGLDGLCAMGPIRGRIVRPILFASKEQVAEHNQSRNIPYSIDLSNLENDFTRNRWRNIVIPQIREASVKDPFDALLSAGDLLGSDKDYFDGLVDGLFGMNQMIIAPGVVALPCKFLSSLHPSVASRLVRRLFLKSFGNTTDLSKDQVEKILSMSADGRGNRSLSLSGGKFAGVHAGAVFFSSRSRSLFTECTGDETQHSEHALSVARCMSREFLVFGAEENATLDISADQLDQTMEVLSEKCGIRLFSVELKIVENPAQVVYNNRTWYCPIREIQGVTVRKSDSQDSIKPAGRSGGKPLRRFLTDRKVPAEIRRGLMIVARGTEVLWVPGLDHALGFTDESSCSRYLAGQGLKTLFDGDAPAICSIQIIPGSVGVIL
jgi:tRNA(Ile)-lysidine synthase